MKPSAVSPGAIVLSALLPISPSSGFSSPHLSGRGLNLVRAMSFHHAQNETEQSKSPAPSAAQAALPEPRKSHCTTVCAVPPPSATVAWEALTRARLELQDPGFYRWPPHANLLYPFLELKSMKKRKEGSEAAEQQESALLDDGMLDALERVAAKCRPFEVTISELGVFGNKNRGVLWAYPRSHAIGEAPPTERGTPFCQPDEPMIELQSLLEAEFPTCTEQRKSRKFHPHMTLSHYASIDDALAAKKRIESWWTPIRYTTDEIYVLRRVGDEGQFEISATVSLAMERPNVIDDESLPSFCRVQIHDPPIRFPNMPTTEEKWVLEERTKLKARRNGSWKTRRRTRAGRQRRNGRNKKERVPDTPDIIAEKRAARKAKREALAAEAAAAASGAEAGGESTTFTS
jgi:2'-5' RNA ligase